MNTTELTSMPASSNRLSLEPRTVKVLYWTTTLLFCSAMLMDGAAGVLREETGKEVMVHLGYPMYVLTIFGLAKLIGAVAILQTKFQTIKEWAYAGFTINFIGAFASRVFVGDAVGLLIPPIVMLVVMFITYFLWKKLSR